MRLLLVLAVASPLVSSGGVCPGLLQGTPPSHCAAIPTPAEYNKALARLHIPSVIRDIVHLLTKSKKCWPADSFPNSDISTSYGGLFIRLAWQLLWIVPLHRRGRRVWRRKDAVSAREQLARQHEPRQSPRAAVADQEEIRRRLELERGPGGKWQWRNPRKEGLMMLTTDIAFLHDSVYAGIVKTFAQDPEKLDVAFGAAWEKLTMRGAVWATGKKCWKTDDRFTSSALLCRAPIKQGKPCGKSPNCCAEGTKCYQVRKGAPRCMRRCKGRWCKEVTRNGRSDSQSAY
ncbi:hypothetical protein DIPPA_23277 [Diplonema papillatum]|nr:hypothetical protein DIPPA_23277 [Diplonema papillatum]